MKKPIGKRSSSVLTPRTSRKVKRLKTNLNTVRCKLFRTQKINTKCFCRMNKMSYTRTKISQLIRDAKLFLSKEAHTLFANELKSAGINKYSRRYDDNLKELCLLWYYASPRGYRTISRVLNLPTVRSLQLWQSELTVSPGINSAVIKALKEHLSRSTDAKEKLACCLFDEISLSEEVHYDSKRDKIVGVIDTGNHRTNDTATSALVCMIRGVAYNWKHILGYWFVGGKSTKEFASSIFTECIDATIAIGPEVKAIICDQGPVNQGIANYLGISMDKTYFLHKDKKYISFMMFPIYLKAYKTIYQNMI